jgi:enoyl-CoA hydratase
MTAPATIKIENEIDIITMDDGKANAINPPMLDALHACLDEAEKSAKVLIITGRENRFSGGFDLKLMMSLPGAEVKALVDNGGKLAHRLYSFPMPVIGACTGHGVAMGCFILLWFSRFSPPSSLKPVSPMTIKPAQWCLANCLGQKMPAKPDI